MIITAQSHQNQSDSIASLIHTTKQHTDRQFNKLKILTNLIKIHYKIKTKIIQFMVEFRTI